MVLQHLPFALSDENGSARGQRHHLSTGPLDVGQVLHGSLELSHEPRHALPQNLLGVSAESPRAQRTGVSAAELCAAIGAGEDARGFEGDHGSSTMGADAFPYHGPYGLSLPKHQLDDCVGLWDSEEDGEDEMEGQVYGGPHSAAINEAAVVGSFAHHFGDDFGAISSSLSLAPRQSPEEGTESRQTQSRQTLSLAPRQSPVGNTDAAGAAKVSAKGGSFAGRGRGGKGNLTGKAAADVRAPAATAVTTAQRAPKRKAESRHEDAVTDEYVPSVGDPVEVKIFASEADGWNWCHAVVQDVDTAGLSLCVRVCVCSCAMHQGTFLTPPLVHGRLLDRR